MASERRIDFVGRVDASSVMGDGSVRIPALIARTGVQVYQYADGSSVREYRPPEEVFATDSVESFDDVAVTIGHPMEPVNPSNWKLYAKGHIDDPAPRDGTFLAAVVIVKDSDTISQVAAGELVELSCGYMVDIDPTPGTTPEGEPYDAVQRNIRGNHVALGPTGWGRAGGDVRLYAGDAADATRGMRTGVCYPVGCTQENANAQTEINAMPLPAETAKKDSAQPEKVVPVDVYDRAVAERDAALAKVQSLENARTDSATIVSKSVAVRVNACRADSSDVLAKLAIDPKVSDRDVMVALIKARKPSINCDGKSDAYVEAMFDIALAEHASDETKRADSKRANTDAVAALVTAQTAGDATPKNDAAEDPVAAAKARRDARNKQLANRETTPAKA